MSGPSLNDFSKQVVTIMPLILREFAKREDNELTRGQITFPQMVALHYLSQHEKAKMTDMAKALSIQMSSGTVLIDRLLRARMLERWHDDADRRVVWVCLTSRGRRVISQILRQKRQSIKEIFKVLNEKERRDYLSALLKVKSHLQAPPKE